MEITLRYGDPGPAFVPDPAPEQAAGRGRAWYRGDMHLHTVRMTLVELRYVSPAVDAEMARALLRVQHAAYAVEAGLIGDDRIPPLHENIEDLQSAELQWLAAFAGDALVGAVAWSEDGAGVDIDRLVVAPRAHRRGVGSALVRAVLHRAGERRTTVSTGRDNAPARRLYERLGFTCSGADEVIPGLWIIRYIHSPARRR